MKNLIGLQKETVTVTPPESPNNPNLHPGSGSIGSNALHTQHLVSPFKRPSLHSQPDNFQYAM